MGEPGPRREWRLVRPLVCPLICPLVCPLPPERPPSRVSGGRRGGRDPLWLRGRGDLGTCGRGGRSWAPLEHPAPVPSVPRRLASTACERDCHAAPLVPVRVNGPSRGRGSP